MRRIGYQDMGWLRLTIAVRYDMGHGDTFDSR